MDGPRGPRDGLYSVAAGAAAERLYAGTRPARLFVADLSDGVPVDADDWTESTAFATRREQGDWGLERHDGIAQVRSLLVHPDAPDRVVAGVEVGGVLVGEDGGATWTSRSVEGFDAPHTDDVHHLAMGAADTIVASTGSGLYRTTDLGRSWTRLDEGHRQRYFRESFVHDGVVYAGGAPASSSSWESDPDHALFECHDGDVLEPVHSPTPEEVAVGWCAAGEDVLAATHRGTLLRRTPDGYETAGTVPVLGEVRGRYLPLTWVDG